MNTTRKHFLGTLAAGAAGLFGISKLVPSPKPEKAAEAVNGFGRCRTFMPSDAVFRREASYHGLTVVDRPTFKVGGVDYFCQHVKVMQGFPFEQSKDLVGVVLGRARAMGVTHVQTVLFVEGGSVNIASVRGAVVVTPAVVAMASDEAIKSRLIRPGRLSPEDIRKLEAISTEVDDWYEGQD